MERDLSEMAPLVAREVDGLVVQRPHDHRDLRQGMGHDPEAVIAVELRVAAAEHFDALCWEKDLELAMRRDWCGRIQEGAHERPNFRKQGIERDLRPARLHVLRDARRSTTKFSVMLEDLEAHTGGAHEDRVEQRDRLRRSMDWSRTRSSCWRRPCSRPEHAWTKPRSSLVRRTTSSRRGRMAE
jgi:hypothetical protein